MKRQTVAWTVENGLCTSCGICKNMCPKECIDWVKRDGMFYPSVDPDRCVSCGLCTEICPGSGMDYPEADDPMDVVYGQQLEAYNAWSRDPIKRHVAASGGVISTTVETLLYEGAYDAAFMLDSYGCGEQMKTVPVTKRELPEDWNLAPFPKSRYLPVSHENAVAYIRNNPEKRVILIGTSCAIRGLRSVITLLHRDPEQYLFLGLFCDKVFQYLVFEYYQTSFGQEKTLTGLHFKNKESGGWPGNMKLFFSDGSSRYLDKSERTRVKECFSPERCLYCVDKLNVCADISLGDNYTGQNSSVLGSNSVIIRTDAGLKAWNAVKEKLEYESVTREQICKAQYLESRLNQGYFGLLKASGIQKKTGDTVTLNSGLHLPDIPALYERAWYSQRKKIAAGAVYDKHPEKVYHVLEGREAGLLESLKRCYFAVRSRLL